MSFQTVLDYYADRLIMQYRGKTKASGTVRAITNCSVCDGLPLELKDAFILDSAIGAQLDVIGRIVGVPRNIYGLDLAHTFFNFTRYSSPASNGFGRYSDDPYGPILFYRYNNTAVYTMTDFEMRSMIQLKIIYNNQYETLYNLKEAFYSAFGGDIDVEDNINVSGGSIDNQVKILLPFDNNVTDIATGKTVTNNNVTFSNTSGTFKWGYSGVFNGTTAYLSVPNSADWNFGSGNWTIDCWINAIALPSDHVIVAQSQATDRSFALNLNSNGLYFQYTTDGSTNLQNLFYWAVPLSTLCHIALVRYGNNLNFYVNGVATGTYDMTGITLFSSSSPLTIGANENNAPQSFFNGYLDEVRVSKGIARWTSNFTPPTSPYSVPTYTNMSITYNVKSAQAIMMQAAQYLKVIPKPMGCKLTLNLL